MSKYANKFEVQTATSDGQVGGFVMVKLDDGTFDVEEVVNATNKTSDGGFTEQDIDVMVNAGRWRIKAAPQVDPAAQLADIEGRLLRLKQGAEVLSRAVAQMNTSITECVVALQQFNKP